MKKKNVTRLMSLFLTFVTASFSVFGSVPSVLAAEENSVVTESYAADGITSESDVVQLPESQEIPMPEISEIPG